MNAKVIIIAMMLVLPLSMLQAEAQEAYEFDSDGIKVILRPVNVETVGVQLFFDGGVTAQSAANQGIDTFLLLASLRGSEKYPKEKLISEVTKMGTDIGADSYYDYTTAYMHCVRKNFDASWDIFVDVLLNPLLKEDEVEIVRSQLISAARQKRDSPEDYVVDLANSLLYEGHPYALDPMGTEDSLNNITIKQLREHNKELITKSRMLLVVVGDFSRDEVERYASAFGSLPEGGEEKGLVSRLKDRVGQTCSRLMPERKTEAAPEERFSYIALDIPNTYVRGVFLAPGMNSKDYYSACIATDILSDTLWEEVRTKRNMAYSVGSGLSSRRDNYGLISVTTNTPDAALDVISAEINKMSQEKLSDERIEEAVNGYITRFYLNNEDTLSQAYQLGLWELNGGGWEKNFEFVENLRSVTPEDVMDFCSTYVKDISMAAVGGQSVNVKL